MITVSAWEYFDEKDQPTGRKSVLVEMKPEDGPPLNVLLSAAQARDWALALCAKADAIDPVN